MAEHELNIVVLEERTRGGWAGVAAITCPCGCGHETVYMVTTSLEGRGVGFWETNASSHIVERQSITTGRKL